LIWKRFLASQMTPAVLVVTAADFEVGRYRFRANGHRIQFHGFLALWQMEEGEEEGGLLPPLEKGDVVKLVELLPTQHFTVPPPRFTEATLVKALEEEGIGRPSTYAPTIATIVRRGYVRREQGRLTPTELGAIVCQLLVAHFNDIFAIPFTARMEDELDEVEEGQKPWLAVLNDFYGPFKQALMKAEEEMRDVKAEMAEMTSEKCEKCGKPMVIRFGRFGKFLACSGYPDCRHTKSLMPTRTFQVRCPRDGGEIVERRSRSGRCFYGCANYPSCTFVVWDPPSERSCPQCGGLMVEKRKKDGIMVQCVKGECGWSEMPPHSPFSPPSASRVTSHPPSL